MSQKGFSLIAAMDQQRGIGIDNKLPWRLKGDLDYFSQTTIQAPPGKMNAVIMGRKTWESLPKKSQPLSNRLNIVLTKQNYALPQAIIKAGSLEEALDFLKKRNDLNEIFIIGGASVYDQSIHHPQCEKIYLTEVEGNFNCDTFFPTIPDSFKLVYISEQHEENNLKYKFLTFEKN